MCKHSSNKPNVPQARQGCNGDLTSREAGDLGKAQMVKKMCPVGRAKYDRQSRTAVGHVQRVAYIAAVMI